MVARKRSDKVRHVRDLGDHVRALAPWTDPEVVLIDGCAALQVRTSHLRSVIASNASGLWHFEMRDAVGASVEEVDRAARDPQIPWDGDVSVVAQELLAVCVGDWTRTLNSSEFSEAMKAKAAEKLDALGQVPPRTEQHRLLRR